MSVPSRTSLPRSRPPLARMLAIHHFLQENRFPNCRRLAQEIEVSSKTIQRDIGFMRDQLELPIEYDPGRRGFYYARPVSSFPLLRVTEKELVAFFIAEKALEQYEGTRLGSVLRQALAKLTAGLEEPVSFSWQELEGAFSLRSVGVAPSDARIFQTIASALLDGKEVEFDYRGLRDPQWKRRRVQPYHLANLEKQWYLIGFDRLRNDLRTFALSRMRDVRKTRFRFRRPEQFSLSSFLGQSFGVFRPSGPPVEVRLRFESTGARLARERLWHPTQKWVELPDGSCELSLETHLSPELERWILAWGSHCEVLEPKELRQKIRAELERVLGFYNTRLPGKGRS
jgi:predicted DNA-binding transcriptional regulator YafY